MSFNYVFNALSEQMFMAAQRVNYTMFLNGVTITDETLMSLLPYWFIAHYSRHLIEGDHDYDVIDRMVKQDFSQCSERIRNFLQSVLLASSINNNQDPVEPPVPKKNFDTILIKEFDVVFLYILPGGILQEVHGIRFENVLRLIRRGTDVDIQPLGQQLGEERRWLENGPVDITIEVRPATECIGERRVRLERPTRVLPVLYEDEGAIAHRADRTVRMLAQHCRGHILQQMLGHDGRRPPGIDEVRVGLHSKLHREGIDHLYAGGPLVVVSPIRGVRKTRLGIDGTLERIRHIIRVRQLPVVPINVASDVKRDLAIVRRDFPRFR